MELILTLWKETQDLIAERKALRAAEVSKKS